MERTQSILSKAWKSVLEGAEEYYGYTITREEALDLYETACLDPDCNESVSIDDVKSGDVLYVSEEEDSDIYTVQIK